MDEKIREKIGWKEGELVVGEQLDGWVNYDEYLGIAEEGDNIIYN